MEKENGLGESESDAEGLHEAGIAGKPWSLLAEL